jgi:hypothetical protein
MEYRGNPEEDIKKREKSKNDANNPLNQRLKKRKTP